MTQDIGLCKTVDNFCFVYKNRLKMCKTVENIRFSCGQCL
ncbi:hypothetical protein ELI_4099 [Eubacterium callanderi]|uniref:Uncharacterized protein n=1 Tax=Eubacterium callanderi TaxID=53442 RepID=E3GH86_9FIRM|nr:hypothetical protein ELI_4099 [Eubacterium callanderi]